MRVIGTAGHVDHGKTTLVSALTGINPDRLKEEQERAMTIDIGFAWFTLPNGEEVGIVDVPGHRDFIENMLAGIGGIDAVLFIVAADEGIMPQTREHLAIVDILQIRGGVIALTKTDLIEDPQWLDLIISDIKQITHGTVLQNSPVLPVSARTGNGLMELTMALEECLTRCPARPDLGRPRLPVDRVFSLPGFGTVVTGTLVDGHFEIGDEVEILPSRRKGKIRGLQTHKTNTRSAQSGSRTAININGVDVYEVGRGDVISYPEIYQPTQLIDVHFHLLKDSSTPLSHNTELKLFIGTTEVLARIRILGIEKQKPGGEAWLQLDLASPITAVRGDHYILRRPSPGETLGGGVVVDPFPGKRHKRFSQEVINKLEFLRQGTPEEILFQTSMSLGPAGLKEIISRSRIPETHAVAACSVLLKQGGLVQLEMGMISGQADILLIAKPKWQSISQQAEKEISVFHLRYPIRNGIPREELKSRLKLTGRIFNAVIKKLLDEHVINEIMNNISLSEFRIRFSEVEQKSIDSLFQKFSQNPFTPPTIKECIDDVGEELFHALVEGGELMVVSEDVVYKKEDYLTQLDLLLEYYQTHSTMTVAQFRDLFNTSRRYALAILEYLDSKGVTIREGDIRRLKTLKPIYH